MTDQADASTDPSPAPTLLTPAEQHGFRQAAAIAISTLDVALYVQSTQPVQTPEDAEVWRQNLLGTAAQPVLTYWQMIVPSQEDEAAAVTRLRQAGFQLCLSLLHEILEKSAAVLAVRRQFTTPPPAPTPASPAPDSAV
jgi:hypothetical protein